MQKSLQTPERKRASQLTAECPRDRLGMEGCGEGRHEERQEEGGAPALPVQMRLKLLFARVGREEKPNTPQKCEKRRSGSVRGGGGSHSIHVTSLLHFLSLSLSSKSQRTSAGLSPLPVKPVHRFVSYCQVRPLGFVLKARSRFNIENNPWFRCTCAAAA